MNNEVKKIIKLYTLTDDIKKIPNVAGVVSKISMFEKSKAKVKLIIIVNNEPSFIKETSGKDLFHTSKRIDKIIQDLYIKSISYDGSCLTPDFKPSYRDLQFSNYNKEAMDVINFTANCFESLRDEVKTIENENYNVTIKDYEKELNSIIRELDINGIKVEIENYHENKNNDNYHTVFKDNYDFDDWRPYDNFLSTEYLILYDRLNNIKVTSKKDIKNKSVKAYKNK